MSGVLNVAISLGVRPVDLSLLTVSYIVPYCTSEGTRLAILPLHPRKLLLVSWLRMISVLISRTLDWSK